MPPPRKPQPYELVEPGEAMFEKINLEFAKEAIQSWIIPTEGGSTEAKKYEYNVEDMNGAKLGVVKVEMQVTGKFTQSTEMEGRPAEQISFDGEKYLRKIGDAEPLPIEPHLAWQNPYVLPAWLFASRIRGRFEKDFAKLTHEGADKSNGRIASRLKLLDAKDRKAYLWIDAASLIEGGKSFPSKFSLDAEGEDDVPAVLFRNWDSAGGISLPLQVIAVEGLNESPKWQMTRRDPGVN
jgi:hypothetical protein